MFNRDFVHFRAGYSHPMWSEFPKIDLEITATLKLVDEQNWDQLILIHGRIGLHIAGYYIYRGGDVDDTVGAAMLGICSAVDCMKRPGFENINPSAFITTAVHRECFNAVITDRVIQTGRRKLIPTCPLIDALDGVEQFDTVEFDEIMELIVKSDFEREVMNLCRNGFVDKEIAELLDTSRFTISRIRDTLYERYVDHVK